MEMNDQSTPIECSSGESTPLEISREETLPPIEFRLPDVEWIRDSAARLKLWEHQLAPQLHHSPCSITIPRSARPILIIPIKGDGNCFYRTIAFLLCGDEEQHDTVKGALLPFLLAHPTNFPLNPLERAELTEPGGYASDVMIHATATFLNIRIYVYSAATGGKAVPERWLRFVPIQDLAVGVPANGGIYINHLNEDHYELVLDVSRSLLTSTSLKVFGIFFILPFNFIDPAFAR